MTIIPQPSIASVLACALAMGLAGGVGAMGSRAMFDAALEDKPCEIVTGQMVATALDVPEDSLEQSHVMASRCAYEMEGDGKNLNVEVAVDTFDTDEDAAEYFRNATRSMSADEVAGAMKAITKGGDDSDKPDVDVTKNVTNSITSALAQNGIQFEDVDGIADQARFELGDGTLHLQKGNLRIRLRAFFGPAMPIPDEITSESMIKAVSDWQNDTMTERRQQALALAKLVLAGL